MIVKYLPLQPHCFAFGGFEIQMLSTLNAACNAGVNASKLDVWNKHEKFDILHVWGLDMAQYNTVYWAKKSGMKIVVTGLLPYIESPYEKFRNAIFSVLRNEFYMHKISALSDAVVLVNDIQQDIAVRYFNTDRKKAYHVPNVVGKDFFRQSVSNFSSKHGIRDFVLTVGNVCKRKNQLNLAAACIKTNTPLVIIGPVLPGESHLGKELKSLISSVKNIVWIEGVEPNSQDLIDAFKECKLFALPSYVEQQPISALEAAACGKPLLLAARAYARQKYYQNCFEVNPDSVDSVASGITAITANIGQYISPKHYVEECTEVNVGNAYKHIYEAVFSKASA